MKFQNYYYWYYHGLLLAALFTTCSLKSGGGGRGGGGSSGGGRGGGGSSGGSRSGGGSGGFSGSRSSGSGFSSGSRSSGSVLKSGTARTIAAGLGGAAVGYVGGRMVSKLGRGVGSMYLPNYHRNYYYGNRNYQGSTNDKLVCRYNIDDDDEIFDLRFDDDSRVTEIVYECNARTEQCCDGLDCCSKQTLPWWGILLIVLAIFLFLLCLVVVCVKCMKRSRKTTDDTASSGYVPTVPQSMPPPVFVADPYSKPHVGYYNNGYSGYPPPAPQYGQGIDYQEQPAQFQMPPPQYYYPTK